MVTSFKKLEGGDREREKLGGWEKAERRLGGGWREARGRIP